MALPVYSGPKVAHLSLREIMRATGRAISFSDRIVDDVGVGDVGVVADRLAREIGVEVDALAGTMFSSVDHVAFVAGWHDNARMLWIGEHHIAIADITNTVVEHDEQVRTAVDA